MLRNVLTLLVVAALTGCAFSSERGGEKFTSLALGKAEVTAVTVVDLETNEATTTVTTKSEGVSEGFVGIVGGAFTTARDFLLAFFGKGIPAPDGS